MEVLKRKKSDLAFGIISCIFGIFIEIFCFLGIVDDFKQDIKQYVIIGIFLLITSVFLIFGYINYRFYFNEKIFYHKFFSEKSVEKYNYSDIENAQLYDGILILKLRGRDTDYKLEFSDYSNQDAAKFGDFIKIIESYVVVEEHHEDDEEDAD